MMSSSGILCTTKNLVGIGTRIGLVLLLPILGVVLCGSAKAQNDIFVEIENVIQIASVKDGIPSVHGFGLVLSDGSNNYAPVVVTAGHTIVSLANQGFSEISIIRGRWPDEDCSVTVASWQDASCAFLSSNEWMSIPLDDWHLSKKFDFAAALVPGPSEHWNRNTRTPVYLKRSEKVSYVGRSGQWYVPTTPGKLNSFDPTRQVWIADEISIFPGSSGAPVFSESGEFIGIIMTAFGNSVEVLSSDAIVGELQSAGFSLSKNILRGYLTVYARSLGDELVESELSTCDKNDGYCGIRVQDVRAFDVTGDEISDLLFLFLHSGEGFGNSSSQYLKIFEGTSFNEYNLSEPIEFLRVGGKFEGAVDMILEESFLDGMSGFTLEGSYRSPNNPDGEEFTRLFTRCDLEGVQHFYTAREVVGGDQFVDGIVHEMRWALLGLTISNELVWLEEPALLTDLSLEAIQYGALVEDIEFFDDDFRNRSGLRLGDVIVGVESVFLTGDANSQGSITQCQIAKLMTDDRVAIDFQILRGTEGQRALLEVRHEL